MRALPSAPAFPPGARAAGPRRLRRPHRATAGLGFPRAACFSLKCPSEGERGNGWVGRTGESPGI